MTNKVEVTQADREAAADLATQVDERDIAVSIRLGTREHYMWGQAFATHRSNAVRPLVEALEKILQRAECYPEDIFGEPDLEAVGRLLNKNGMGVQMDRMHASWGRRIMSDIGNEARTALQGVTGND